MACYIRESSVNLIVELIIFRVKIVIKINSTFLSSSPIIAYEKSFLMPSIFLSEGSMPEKPNIKTLLPDVPYFF